MADNEQIEHGNFVRLRYRISDEWEKFTWPNGSETLRVRTDHGHLVLTDRTGRFLPVPGEPAILLEFKSRSLANACIVEYDGSFATLPGAWVWVDGEQEGFGHVEFRGRYLEEPDDEKLGLVLVGRYYDGKREGDDDE